MIKLENVSKYFPTPSGKFTVLNNISFVFESGANFAIMGAEGAGKTTLIRLLANIESPSSGIIRRNARVSWPLSSSRLLHTAGTGAENIRFACRLYGADYRRVQRLTADFAEIDGYLDEPVRTYSTAMRARLAFGLALAVRFDVYLIDEVIVEVGDVMFRERCHSALRDCCKTAAVIMASQSPSTAMAYCDHGVILEKGKLKTFPTLDATIKAYEQHLKQPDSGE